MRNEQREQSNPSHCLSDVSREFGWDSVSLRMSIYGRLRRGLEAEALARGPMVIGGGAGPWADGNRRRRWIAGRWQMAAVVSRGPVVSKRTVPIDT